MRLAQHIRISVTATGTGVAIAVFDLHSRQIVKDLTDYARYMLDIERLDQDTAYKRIAHCVRFKEYLRLHNVVIGNLDNQTLENYRDWELKEVTEARTHRGDEKTAMRTTNEKLTSVYAWLSRLKNAGALQHAEAYIPSKREPRSKTNGAKTVFLQKTGHASKHHAGFVVNEAKLDAILYRGIAEGSDPHTAHRDWLIAKVATEVGLRRGSNISLQAKDFEPETLAAKLEQNPTGVDVRPSDQKFDYKKLYVIPAWLCWEISNFCRDYRNPIVESKQNGKELSEGCLFVSSTTAKKLTGGAISRRFRAIMAELGAPKGIAIHTLRSTFAANRLEEETEYRVANRLDTSTKTLATAVSQALGQEDSKSMFRYVSQQQSRQAQKRAAEKRRASQEQAQELTRLHTVVGEQDFLIAELRAQLASYKPKRE